MAAKKRKAATRRTKKKATAKPKSARRAVNIKVNVLSKNPKKRKTKKPAKRRTPRPAARLKRKHAGRRFVICAHTRTGKRFYETRARKFIADRKQARIFPTFSGASKEAHRVLKKMPESVKSLAVELA